MCSVKDCIVCMVIGLRQHRTWEWMLGMFLGAGIIGKDEVIG